MIRLTFQQSFAAALIGLALASPLAAIARAVDDVAGPQSSRRPPSSALLPPPAALIEVTLRSGRTFSGEIDPQTDSDVLWLRSTHGGIVLIRPIEWNRVVQARYTGKELSGDELRTLSEGLKSERPQPQDSPPAPAPPPPLPARDASSVPNPPAFSVERHGRVASIDLDAQLGHWSPTVESSGLTVRVTPLDADGRPTAIDGTLDVELLGRVPAVNYTAGDFPTVGHWTLAVRADACGPSGAVYHCPFQALHPDFDTELYAHGLVHVRLTVPEQGVFEASQPLVRIRQYSPMRDRLQETTDERFFPQETTERGQ